MEEVEEVNHLFCTCKEVWLIWVKVFHWWGLDVVLPDTVQGVAELFRCSLGRIVGKEISASIFLVVGWYVWFWRNDKVFGRGGEFKEQLLEMIQAKSFSWVKMNVAGCVFSFFQWKFNLRDCATAIKRHKRCLKLFHRQHKEH
ncbi:hypothetical protein SLA2020_059990 [Shorea laevis]